MSTNLVRTAWWPWTIEKSICACYCHCIVRACVCVCVCVCVRVVAYVSRRSSSLSPWPRWWVRREREMSRGNFIGARRTSGTSGLRHHDVVSPG